MYRAANETAIKALRTVLLLAAALSAKDGAAAEPGLRAGAAQIDITPVKLPVIINGSFEERTADKIFDPLYAKALVLDDGQTVLALVIVDNTMMPRSLLDEAKRLASKATGIPVDNMLISATHTHSTPSVDLCLGARPDVDYVNLLLPSLVRAVTEAAAKRQPARIGWASVHDPLHTFCRQWIRRPDRILADPFGVMNGRSNMHPGHQNPDSIGPSGPVDDELSVLSVQTADGAPLCVLANYSMHYYGAQAISADYFGRFSNIVAEKISGQRNPSCVVAMSQGTSGDQMWPNYGNVRPPDDIDKYSAEVAEFALDALKRVMYQDHVSLAAATSQLTLKRRMPSPELIARCRGVLANLNGRLPATIPEVYAQEQIEMAKQPERELLLQAMRIGELGITGIPNEVFGLSGLKIKAKSPLGATFNIELANGSEGYIPPPEQHKLGGYTTWPARTAGLEIDAETKIVDGIVELLEKVSGKPRRPRRDAEGEYAAAVIASAPKAYFRLNEMEGRAAIEQRGGAAGRFEDFVVPFLPGPEGSGFAEHDQPSAADEQNGAPLFAGGRLVLPAIDKLGDTYSAELWFWNGLDNNARLVTGYLFSRGTDGDQAAAGDHLGIGGTHGDLGCLLLYNGNEAKTVVAGKNPLQPKAWHQVVLVRQGTKVAVYLDGHSEPELQGEAAVTFTPAAKYFIGGRCDNFANFEGKIDEVAIYDRALEPSEIATHFAASGHALPAAATNEPEPTEPSDSLAKLHVREGYDVELVAAEPLVRDPVAIQWSADGKLWVAEMADYPLGLDGQMQPGGRVRFLEDTDADGRYDRSTLFLDHINFPTGVLPWRKGVLISAAPDILYAEDTDGDGKADVRQVLFTGFKEGNPQLRVNGLEWGLDGWVYVANGLSGGDVRSEKTGAVVNIAGRDLRIRPDDGLADAQSGVTEFSRCRDDWGNHFGCDNSNPLWHFVLSDNDVRRNAHAAPPDARRQLLVPANPSVFPISQPQKRYHSYEQTGRFTSACGATIYRDKLLFGSSDNDRITEHAFVCEPVHNLVRHAVLERRGTSFDCQSDADRARGEFLASSDPWFRPTMCRTGPDGALYVVDMYRFIIEHPDWLPPLGRSELAGYFRLGEDRGRIYRIYPTGKRPPIRPPLALENENDFLAAMRSTNGWVRDAAQQALSWRGDAGLAVRALEGLLLKAEGMPPAAPPSRSQALASLAALDVLSPNLLAYTLLDPHPEVRRLAVSLGATHSDVFAKSSILDQLVADPAPEVRLQLAATLGNIETPQAAQALGQLAAAADDIYSRATVLSSLSAKNLDAALAAALAAPAGENLDLMLDAMLALAASLGRDAALVDTLETVLKPTAAGGYTAAQLATVAHVLPILARRGKSIADLRSMGSSNETTGQSLEHQLERLQSAARLIAADAAADVQLRTAAVGLLLTIPAERAADLALCQRLLVPQTPPETQIAIVDRLARDGDDGAPGALLAGWPGHSPALRQQVLAVLISRPAWTSRLLEAVEQKRVVPAEIDAARRQQLAAAADVGLRERAAKLFSLASAADRQRALERLRPALALAGDAGRGQPLFEKKCSACHQVGTVGSEVGPNLAALTDRAPQSLLVAILDPSRAVEPRYLSFVAVTDDGRTRSGIIEAETGTSITLAGEQGKRETILRSELEELRATGKSLMPDGLEQDLSPQDLADLLAYLDSARR